jgi:lysophospholipase L1-like esterase
MLKALALSTALALTSTASFAQSPLILAEDATRYMALGDSISAGYKAMPATQGFAYLLYQEGAFDHISHTLFCNAAVPGATSTDVLQHQVPQTIIPASATGFRPRYITLTVGGNDLLSILAFARTHPDPIQIFQFAQQVLATYGGNLAAILLQLRSALPASKVFVANQYSVPEVQALVPGADQIVAEFNRITKQVVELLPGFAYLVDVNSAFAGRQGLLLVERHGASPTEVHVTSVGHRVLADAFAEVIAGNK